jgi:hypothetical protein
MYLILKNYLKTYLFIIITMEKILLLSLLIKTCISHISMSFPPSRRNQLSKYYIDSGLVNYNLRSPLMVTDDKFSFPCKGFPKGPSVATFNNNKLSVTLEGTAVHGGGHCQFGVSYDDKTFVVLTTVIGNCLLDTKSYSFDLPQNSKGGDMTIFWTWINRIGNREYYMECADITVNTNGNNPQIPGKELLIVNLPGYPKVPEWEPNSPSSIDGRDLLASRKDIQYTQITKNVQTNNQQPSITYLRPTPTKQPILPPSWIRPPNKQVKCDDDDDNNDDDDSDDDNNSDDNNSDDNNSDDDNKDDNNSDNKDDSKSSSCNSGEMSCNGTGFNTCVYNSWVYRDCASGTACKPNGNSIICDFI